MIRSDYRRMKVYLVQHTRTLNFLPTDFATGGTYWEGEAGKAPRTFHTRQAAQNFINNWVKGHARMHYEHSGTFGEDVSSGLVYEDRGRSHRDVRIREGTIVLEPIQEELL